MSNEKSSFTGKIAFATNDQINITGHLGRCRSFMIVAVEGNKIINKEPRENVFTHHRLHQHDHNQEHHHGEGGGHSHANLIEGLKDCAYLVSQGGGWRIMEDLKQNNIIPIFTDINLIDDAASKFLNGELSNNPDLTCNHNN
jgi:predicted Fe-Mo cluster-binding NifX family protein